MINSIQTLSNYATVTQQQNVDIISGYANSEILYELRKAPVISSFAEAYTPSSNSGNQVMLYRTLPNESILAPIQDGVNSAGTTTYSEQAYQITYAPYCVSTIVSKTAVDLLRTESNGFQKKIQDIIRNHAYTWSFSMESIITQMLIQGCVQNYYATGTASGGIGTLTSNDVINVTTKLQLNSAIFKTEPVGVNRNISSQGVLPGYIAVTHIESRSTLLSLQGFKEISTYPTADSIIHMQEIGSIYGTRILLSNNASLKGTDVTGAYYKMIIFGHQTFMLVMRNASHKKSKVGYQQFANQREVFEASACIYPQAEVHKLVPDSANVNGENALLIISRGEFGCGITSYDALATITYRPTTQFPYQNSYKALSGELNKERKEDILLEYIKAQTLNNSAEKEKLEAQAKEIAELKAMVEGLAKSKSGAKS